METSSLRIEIHHSDWSLKTADVNEVDMFTTQTVWTNYIVRWTIVGKNTKLDLNRTRNIGYRRYTAYTRITIVRQLLKRIYLDWISCSVATVQNETCGRTGYPPNYAFSLFTLYKEGNRKTLNTSWSSLFQTITQRMAFAKDCSKCTPWFVVSSHTIWNSQCRFRWRGGNYPPKHRADSSGIYKVISRGQWL